MKKMAIVFFVFPIFLVPFYLTFWSYQAVLIPESRELKIVPGIRLWSLSKELHEKKFISDPWKFWLWIRWQGSFPRFQAGSYHFEGEVSPRTLRKSFTSGDIYAPIILEVTFPEGWTLDQIFQRLLEKGLKDEVEWKRAVKNFSDWWPEGYYRPSHLEGFFAPSTYRFYKNFPSSLEILQLGVQTFFKNLPPLYEILLKEKGLNLEEGVIFASLLEKEVSLEEERAFVSEVIWNRLKNGIPLFIDATIIYGLGSAYKGRLTSAHLRDRKNLYNTRFYRGLPPTAIGAPSVSSLKAVLSPSREGYFYYVRKPGSLPLHRFSRTLKEHNGFVREWVKSLGLKP